MINRERINEAKFAPEQRMNIRQTYQVNRKNGWVLFLLWFFFGGFGLHRFYLGQNKYGLFLLVTLGGLGIGLAIDLIAMWFSLKHRNAKLTERLVKEKTAGHKLTIPTV